jgi:FkbM family methyltransferase
MCLNEVNMKIQIYYKHNLIPFTFYVDILYKYLSKHHNVKMIYNYNEIEPVDCLFMFVHYISEVENYDLLKNTNIIAIVADQYRHAFYGLSEEDIIGKLRLYESKKIYLWDFYHKNILFYKEQNFTHYYFLPLSYSPNLEFSMKTDKKEMDVVLIGATIKRRTDILDKLSKHCIVGLYNGIFNMEYFFQILNKAKIVINIYAHDIDSIHSGYFDYYRLSMLYSNKLFVISEKHTKVDYELQPLIRKIENVAVYAPYDDLVDTVRKYLHIYHTDYNQIETIVNKTYEIYKEETMEQQIDRFFESSIGIKNNKIITPVIPPVDDTIHSMVRSEDEIMIVLNKLHRELKLKYGTFNEEFPEQKMNVRYLSGKESVLEIGGNIGRNSMIIGSLINNDRLVVLESDDMISKQLEENRDLNKYTFHIENSALSKRKLIQQIGTWDTKPSDVLEEGYKWVNTMTFDEIQNKYNVIFDTLVIDCEGAFYYILMDMPEILDNIKLIMMENDYRDIHHKQYVDDILFKHNFCIDYQESGGWGCCYDNFFQVWTK